MSRHRPKAAGDAPPTPRRVAVAASVGATIEWYDFFLYGSAAALVFNKLFFPDSDPLVGTLLSFLTYAVGFAARPLEQDPFQLRRWGQSHGLTQPLVDVPAIVQGAAQHRPLRVQSIAPQPRRELIGRIAQHRPHGVPTGPGRCFRAEVRA